MDDAPGRRVDQEDGRLFVADRDHRAAVAGDRDARECLRCLDLSQQLPVRHVDHRDRGVFLVVGVKALAIGRDGEPVAVGRIGIDGVDHRIGLRIDHRDHRAVFASNVNQSIGAKPDRVRRDIGAKIDVACTLALEQVDYAQHVTGIWIAAVDAVAEDRYIGKSRFRDH